jgi:hypothetical protein
VVDSASTSDVSFHLPKLGSREMGVNHYKEQLSKYKEDQLLSNPGGDYFFLKRQTPINTSFDQRNFVNRVSKDLRDCWDNVKNLLKDLVWGSQYRYSDERANIQSNRKQGVAECVREFFKDLLSAFSFGTYRNNHEPNPAGIGSRIKFFARKFLGEAVLKDAVLAIPASINNMVEDAIMAGLNAAEVIPDATIGNIEAGQKLTTAIFDNGQVFVDYLTDILPAGEAWQRVHSTSSEKTSLRIPMLANLRTPEQGSPDPRWKFVRNTRFRKLIETFGSIVADFFSIKWLSVRISGQSSDEGEEQG